jgi:DNA-directed RNA polymerase specialized sigma24 family protein
VNESRDAQTRRLLDEVRSSEPEDAPDLVAVVGRAPEPELVGLDTEAALTRILALPLEEAEVILLRVLGGSSVTEVARALETSSRRVRSLQRRGLRQLAAMTSLERSSA